MLRVLNYELELDVDELTHFVNTQTQKIVMDINSKYNYNLIIL